MALEIDRETRGAIRAMRASEFRRLPSEVDHDLIALSRSLKGSMTVRLRRRSGLFDLVFHVFVPGDVLAASGTDTPASITGEHVVPQIAKLVNGYRVVQRPYLPQLITVADLIAEARRHGHDRDAVEKSIWRFMDGALAGLATTHDAGLVHANIRPDRFGIYENGTIAVRDIGTGLLDDPKASRYLAPEIRSGGRGRHTPSTDIYAFLQVAREVLQPFRGDSESPELDELDARVRWLHDYFEPRTDRPTATELRIFLVRGEGPTSNITLDWFRGPHGPGKGRSAAGHIQSFVTKFPETRFALDGSKSGDRIRKWLSLSESKKGKYNVSQYRSKHRSGQEYDLQFELQHRPKEIDDLWINSIHRMLFGFPIDPKHDERIDRLGDSVSVDRERFLQAREAANRARLQLLGEHDFLSTREAIQQLGRTALAREDFMVLRRWGFVLAVPDHGRWLYPVFQFANGDVSPRIQQVHGALSERRRRTPNPWSELTYWSVGRMALGGKALKDVLWQERSRAQIDHVIDSAVI